MSDTSIRPLLSSEYIPFGSQYYRAPSPAPQDWESDLKNIADLGFNTVKFWVQWRWNQPDEERFSFDDIDRLMDLAHHHGLKVTLNTIFDVAPVWIYRKYPDASMLTLDGRRIGPQTQPHRQIGGLGLCFNHSEAQEQAFRFLTETVKRYKDHPALEVWNVGSEPELTSSMAELRLYADDAAKMGDMLCYCDRCQEAFKGWLKSKYGTIDKLNLPWNRNYRSFDEVEVPKTRNAFNDLIDWRMFFVHTIGVHVRRRFEVAKREDGGKHSLMCHHVFIQGFPVTSTANDPWSVGQYGDLHGITQMDDPMMCDVVRSCAKGKPVISAEMLLLPGYTLDLPRTIDANDIKRAVFTGVAANLKGFIFWQYRPEVLGREAPAWGLTTLDGSATPWLKSFTETGRVLQKNSHFLLDAKPRPAEIALFYSPENQIFAWASTGSEKSATDSILGIHQALYEGNHLIDLLHPKEFESDILSRYKILIVPFPYFLSEALCRKIEAWVKAGGVLIGESYFAGWNVEEGRHQTVVPGYGLHAVFQSRQGVIDPAGVDGVELRVKKKLTGLAANAKLVGSIVQERLVPEGAEVLATFSDGSAAATIAVHGKGKAILIGSYLGLAYARRRHENNAKFFRALIDLVSISPRPLVSREVSIRVDVLTEPDGKAMLILRNLKSKATKASVWLPLQERKAWVEQFTGQMLKSQSRQGGVEINVSLSGREVRVYCA